MEYIRTNLDTLQETIQKKQENMSYLINVMQAKLQQSQTQPTKVWTFESRQDYICTLPFPADFSSIIDY